MNNKNQALEILLCYTNNGVVNGSVNLSEPHPCIPTSLRPIHQMPRQKWGNHVCPMSDGLDYAFYLQYFDYVVFLLTHNSNCVLLVCQRQWLQGNAPSMF